MTNINAHGTHTNKNSKPVFGITDGIIYASVTDAAEAIGISVGDMSKALSRNKLVRGRKFCFIAEINNHLEEISSHINTQRPKAIAYDDMMARKEEARRANESFERHRANCEKLRARLVKEERRMREAQIKINELKSSNPESYN